MKTATVYNSKSFGDILSNDNTLKSDSSIFYNTMVKVSAEKEKQELKKLSNF